MNVARRLMLLLGLAALAMTPAAAQDDTRSNGRSITTLAAVPLKSRDGADILLGSRIVPGRPTVIAFWASWCLPCVAEAPYLARMRREHGDRYNFIYINRRDADPDPQQPPAAVERFLNRAGMADLDYVSADRSAYRRILGTDANGVPSGMVGIPRVYLFNRNGRQIYTSLGFAPAESAKLERLLKQVVER